MKKMIVVPALFCAMIASYSVKAQDNGAKKPQAAPQQAPQPPQKQPDPHQKSQESAEKATKRYGLNEQQKNQWQAAAMQRNMERMGLRMQMQGETTPEQRKEIREQARTQNARFDSQVKEFLTPEQYAKFTKDKQEHEKKRKAAAKEKKAASEKEVHELEEN